MSTITDLLAPLARGVITRMSRSRLPQTHGALELPGLLERVEIIRDRWGVPHIYAANQHDLFFAQGFVHAQDRLFQMELNRRTARGRLSELFGEIALDTDRATRTFGFERLGRADWENAADDLRQVIVDYTKGINAYLEHPGRKLPVEFALLGLKPEPWEPVDTTSFARVMIWQLSHAWYSELVRSQLTQAVGAQHAAEWEIYYPLDNPLTLPEGVVFNRLKDGGVLRPEAGPFLSRPMGSNAWAVSGSKTTTGSAFLCNDMHLQLAMPSLWYEVHLLAGDFKVTGVSLPGTPLVLVGHNAHLAWGATLAFTDCEDLFIEEFDPQNPRQYRGPQGWLQAEVLPEAIRVKGRSQPHTEEVFITRHGPIISDVVSHPQQRLAVCSMALQPAPTFRGFLLLNQAKNWDDFVHAMRLIEAPQLNIAYADIEGNIGYWVTGRTPIRGRGDGSTPAPGWSGEYDWINEVPFEAMPHAFNPQQGYIVTCNHRIVPDDYPYFLGNAWMNGYRARRIVEVFQSKEQLSPQDFRALHVDFTCPPARELVSALGEFESSDPDVIQALEMLRGWDARLTTESAAGALYEAARHAMVRNLLVPTLGEELSLRLLGQGFHPLLLATHEFYGHDTVALLRILRDAESWWLAQAGGRQALIERSLKQAISWLREHLGADPAVWSWGKMHRVRFAHTLGLQKPLDQVFNRGPYPIGGDTDTPCQTAFFAHDPYDNNAWAPSYRQIVDMGDLSRSEAMFPPGQSGQLGSPHYDDLIEPWLKGEYHPMLWEKEQIEQGAESRLQLHPRGAQS